MKDLSPRQWWSLTFGLTLGALLLLSIACVTPVPPPVQPPGPPPVEIVHTPVCTPPTLVFGCWHNPGTGWAYIPPLPPKPETACPKKLAPGASVSMGNKIYGNGFDSSTFVLSDPDFCFAIHGVRTDRCHLEGWPQRKACELELMGGCPVWQWSESPAGPWAQCKQNGSQAVTCDHFGTTQVRDDPQTIFYEGPPECAAQRDAEGNPNAGWFMVAHGKGFVRACTPGGSCSDDPKPVDW